jgi:dynein heavy chain
VRVALLHRRRLRTFPCLVACTTIDWFSEWPAQALASVAARFLHDVELDSAEVRGRRREALPCRPPAWAAATRQQADASSLHSRLASSSAAPCLPTCLPQVRSAVEGMCGLFHQSVRQLAEDFRRDLGRHYYATPTSYLELIKTYKQLLASKRQQVRGAVHLQLGDCGAPRHHQSQ